MNVHIINIGDELLIGQVINTNASKMAAMLNANGMNINHIDIIGDNEQNIINALDNALNYADAILITGGLGPTKDDITKTTLCRYFNSTFVEDQASLENIKQIFEKRGFELTETNRKQAEVPACCTVIVNQNGTAPCMWFEHKNRIIVAMPGVPFEMYHLMNDDIIPRLKNHFETEHFLHKNFLMYGIGESFLSDKLTDFEQQLPKHIKLAYLPNMGIMRLRLSARGYNEQKLIEDMANQTELLLTYISEYVFGYDDDSLEKVLGDILRTKNATLAIAESCTGGNISHFITSVSGSSAYFYGGVTAYDNSIKTKLLGVPETCIAEHGAVSQQTAEAMALGVKQKMQSDYAIATTGIAGPDGGSPDKPVGTVWIAIATPSQIISNRYIFNGNRASVIKRATDQALYDLYKITCAQLH